MKRLMLTYIFCKCNILVLSLFVTPGPFFFTLLRCLPTNTMCPQMVTYEGIILTSPCNSQHRWYKLYVPLISLHFFIFWLLSFCQFTSISPRGLFCLRCCCCCCCSHVKMWYFQNIGCYESMKKTGRILGRGFAEIQQWDKQIGNYCTTHWQTEKNKHKIRDTKIKISTVVSTYLHCHTQMFSTHTLSPQSHTQIHT